MGGDGSQACGGEDEVLVAHLRTMGAAATRDLHRYLLAPPESRERVLRQFVARPDMADLAQLQALAHQHEEVRLRLLRATRHAGGPRVGT